MKEMVRRDEEGKRPVRKYKGNEEPGKIFAIQSKRLLSQTDKRHNKQDLTRINTESWPI